MVAMLTCAIVGCHSMFMSSFCSIVVYSVGGIEFTSVFILNPSFNIYVLSFGFRKHVSLQCTTYVICSGKFLISLYLNGVKFSICKISTRCSGKFCGLSVVNGSMILFA